jgi:hypothetical protein
MDGHKHCVVRDSSFVACQAVSNEKILLGPEEEGITTFRNVGKNLPVDTA